MGAFGEKLRREREMRGVTLDEISESTKISRRHLESLEKEDFDSLPGGVFNKGFVRAYARFVGINEDQAVADYVAVAGDSPIPEDKFPLEIHIEPNRELNPRNYNVPVLLAIVGLAGVLMGYGLWSRTRKVERTAHADTNTQAAAETLPADAPPAKAAPAGQKPASHSAAQPQQRVAATKKTPEGGAVPRKRVAPLSTFFIVIKAKEDSWISVTADGRTSQEVLHQDKQKVVKAGKEIILKTGNAGGIEVSYNGRSLGPIGSESETRTLMFTPAGPAQ